MSKGHKHRRVLFDRLPKDVEEREGGLAYLNTILFPSLGFSTSLCCLSGMKLNLVFTRGLLRVFLLHKEYLSFFLDFFKGENEGKKVFLPTTHAGVVAVVAVEP